MKESNIVPLNAAVGVPLMPGDNNWEKRPSGQGSAIQSDSAEKVTNVGFARRMSAPLIQLQERSQRELLKALHAMFDKADDALFELAEKAQNNSEQNLYFESMREVRLKRREIEEHFSAGLHKAFACLFDQADTAKAKPPGLSLMENDVVEQMVAVDTMIAKAEKQHAPALTLLLARIAYLAETEPVDENNPLGPRLICENFSGSCRILSVDIKARLVLFKLFDMHVVSAFDRLYASCNSCLEANDVLPGAQWQDSQSGTVNTSTRNRQGGQAVCSPPVSQHSSLSDVDIYQKLQQFSTSPEGEPAFAELTATLNAMPVTAKEAATTTATTDRAMLFGVLDKLLSDHARQACANAVAGRVVHGELLAPQKIAGGLLQALQATATGEVGGISQQQSDAIGLVVMLFQFVLEDGSLADPMKALISQLQVPVVKVAMDDVTFFDKGSHPARRLLNELTTASLGWAAGEGNDYLEDGLYKKIAESINHVLEQHEKNAEVFSEVLADFISYVTAQNRRAALLEKRIVDAEAGRDKSESARHYVNQLLAARINDREVPGFIATLLTNVWSNVLFLRYLKQGVDSPAWLSAVEAMDSLLWTVSVSRSMSDRQAIMKKIPAVLQTVREGLVEISFDAVATEKFFSDLERLHMDVMLRPSANTSSYKGSEDIVDEVKLSKHLVQGNEAAAVGSNTRFPRQVQGANAEESTQKPAVDVSGSAVTPGVEALEHYRVVAEELGTGQWVEIHERGSKTRCRLVAVLRNSGKRIFANRSGAKVGEFTVEELAIELENGNMVLLDDARLFDKALASVIGGVK